MKIYLACPYSHPDPRMREGRFYAVNQRASEIMKRGHIVFSPISHSHPIHAQCGLPGDWGFWQAFDESFIGWCDEVWVLRLPGWKTSKGVKEERKIAKQLGKPVKLI